MLNLVDLLRVNAVIEELNSLSSSLSAGGYGLELSLGAYLTYDNHRIARVEQVADGDWQLTEVLQ